MAAGSSLRPVPLAIGLVAAAVAWFLLPVNLAIDPAATGALSPQGRVVACVGIAMAIWWMTEALPIEVTGLVPLTAFPLLGATTIDQAAAPYADRIIFLFLGGMLLGQAMEAWGLHRRFALRTIILLGSTPTRLVGAFLLATAAISMFVSNTAATIMMLPIGASVAGWIRTHLAGDDAPARHCRGLIGPAIVLAIAFGASIGGVGTVIGTPPIAQYAAFMKTVSHEVSFVEWLQVGVPTLLIVLPITWFVLTRIVFRFKVREIPGVQDHIRDDLTALGPMRQGETLVLIIFAAAATCWVLSRQIKVDDTVIAIAAAILLFVLGARDDHGHRRPLLTWPEAERVPWGILLLFGGGLSLAAAIKSTGVDLFIAAAADGLSQAPLLPLLWVIALVTILLTEFTSNTALVAAGLPVGAAIAARLDVPPAAILVTITLTASLGFMMPAGTAPNALVFASGQVTMRQMMRAGFLLDLACAALIPPLVVALLHAGLLPGT